jgi:outer membrane protein assembly factor BamB
LRKSLVFDTGEKVYFYYQRSLSCFDKEGNFSWKMLPTTLRVEAYPGGRPARGALWGRTRMLLFEPDAQQLLAFDLDTGEPVNVDQIKARLPYRRLAGLVPADDGSVWVRAFDESRSTYVLHRIFPDGEVTSPEQAVVLCREEGRFSRGTQATAAATDGSIWFALEDRGILRQKDGRVRLFDGRVGFDLGGCRYLLEGFGGQIYAASSRAVYTYRPGPATGSEAAVRKPTVLKEIAWRHEAEVSFGQQVEDRIILLNRRARVLPTLDATTGEQLVELKCGPYLSDRAWFAPGRRPGEILMSDQKAITVIDGPSGEVRETTPYGLDYRIPPLPLDDDYLVGKGYRGSRLVRIDRQGNTIWECELPGYTMLQPAVYGAFAVVQTRGGSYGGQATSGVDLNSGELMWTDTTNAYGRGAAFGDDAAYVVEADVWLSPKTTEGWLICRKPTTGEKLWHYRRASTTINHRPLVDQASNRVFAVFDRGEVVCLQAKDGRLAWGARLPEGPYGSLNLSYVAYWPIMDRHHDWLMIVDRNRVLHMLDTDNGEYLAALALTTAFSRDGQTMEPVEILAMPRIVGDNLVVLTSKGVASYRFGK